MLKYLYDPIQKYWFVNNASHSFFLLQVIIRLFAMIPDYLGDNMEYMPFVVRQHGTLRLCVIVYI